MFSCEMLYKAYDVDCMVWCGRKKCIENGEKYFFLKKREKNFAGSK